MCFVKNKQFVEFLEHIVSAKGVATYLAKVATIKQWSTARNAREVHRFLGLASYYYHFVRDFLTVAKPLHLIMEKITIKITA